MLRSRQCPMTVYGPFDHRALADGFVRNQGFCCRHRAQCDRERQDEVALTHDPGNEAMLLSIMVGWNFLPYPRRIPIDPL